MPAPRIYSVSPNGSSGPDFGSQIEALSGQINSLSQSLAKEVTARKVEDADLFESIHTLEETVASASPKTPKIELYTINADLTLADIVFPLLNAPVVDSVEIEIISGPDLHQTFDFVVEGSNIRLLSSSELCRSLVVGDQLEISYLY